MDFSFRFFFGGGMPCKFDCTKAVGRWRSSRGGCFACQLQLKRLFFGTKRPFFYQGSCLGGENVCAKWISRVQTVQTFLEIGICLADLPINFIFEIRKQQSPRMSPPSRCTCRRGWKRHPATGWNDLHEMSRYWRKPRYRTCVFVFIWLI